MWWTEAIPAITGMLYAAAALGYASQRQWGFALAYLAYGVANVGLIMAAISGRSPS